MLMVPLFAPQLAGILSGDPRFAAFIRQQHSFEGQATNFIRGYCDISSRREIDMDVAARRKFLELRNDFDARQGVIASPH